MRAVFLLSLSGALANIDLCGQWKQSLYGSNGKNCVSTPRCNIPSPPRVTETFDFHSATSTYVYTNIQYGSSSCQSNLHFHVEIRGDYSLGDSNVTNWTGITYTPVSFFVNYVVSGSVYPPNSTQPLSCIDLIAELNIACPCNGTWTIGVAREVVPANCSNDCDDPGRILDTRPRYGNIQIRQNATTKYLVLSETDLDPDIGFSLTTLDFSQEPACGRGCKSCVIPPGGGLGSNCSACCDQHASPINSTSESNCQCKAKYHNVAPDNFTLKCTSGSSPVSSGLLVVFGLLSLLLSSTS